MLKDRCLNDEGAVMLTVVIIMSILFILGSIVYGYSLRQYQKGRQDQIVVDVNVIEDTAMSDLLVELCDRVDVVGMVGNFSMSRNNLHGKSGLSYQMTISEAGNYDISDYQETNYSKTYKIKRTIPEPLPEPIPVVTIQDTAVDMALSLGDYSKSRKFIIHIQSVTEVFYEVEIIVAK